MKNKPIIRFFRGTDKLINFCMMFLLLGLLLYGGYSLWDTNQMFNQASAFAYEIYHPMREEEPGFDGLRAINPDVFGWLTVFGTNIDYPLVQGTDNLHYVDTNARGLPALTGAIFLDFRNNQNFTDFNNIIYGHDMAREAMFGEIANFADEGYFNARQFGSIFTGQRHYGVEFFAFLLVDAHDSGFYNPRMSDQIVKADHLDRIREEAIQFRDVDVTTADQLVMLSTCTETITNGRFVLIGRLTNHIEQNPFADARVGTGRFVRAWAGLFHSPVAIFVGAITGTLLIILLTLMTLSTVKRLKEKGARGTGPTEQAEEETSLLPIDQKKGAHLVRREFIYLSSKILGIVLVITLVVTFVFGFVSVEDFAMSPAIQAGDIVLFNRLERNFIATDLIVVPFEGERQVRRVVAVAGDTVDITDWGLVVNDRPQQEPRVFEDTAQFVEGINFPIVVPEGEVFVLGDSRGRAIDSRIYGTVNVSDTFGSVVTIFRWEN